METPYIRVQKQIVKENIQRMQDDANNQGIALRPHCKTHKTPEIALWQLEAGAKGITVAKISEANVMFEAGITDIFIAYPIVTDDKIANVVALCKKATITLAVDSVFGANKLAEAAKREGMVLNVRLEVDTGLNRAGARSEKVIEVARSIHNDSHLRLDGIFTFKGAVVEEKSTLDTSAAGEEEVSRLQQYKARLAEEGISVPVISAGSTPTAQAVSKTRNVEEIRPGTYVFNDAMQYKLGVCELRQCAASVVVTIVSLHDDRLAVIDGGSKTFATDIQPDQEPLRLNGFGIVIGHPDAVFLRMNEEHGIVQLGENHGLNIGDTVEIIPNHICSTVNLHNHFYVEDEQGETTKIRVAARGCLQ